MAVHFTPVDNGKILFGADHDWGRPEPANPAAHQFGHTGPINAASIPGDRRNGRNLHNQWNQTNFPKESREDAEARLAGDDPSHPDYAAEKARLEAMSEPEFRRHAEEKRLNPHNDDELRDHLEDMSDERFAEYREDARHLNPEHKLGLSKYLATSEPESRQFMRDTANSKDIRHNQIFQGMLNAPNQQHIQNLSPMASRYEQVLDEIQNGRIDPATGNRVPLNDVDRQEKMMQLQQMRQDMSTQMQMAGMAQQQIDTTMQMLTNINSQHCQAMLQMMKISGEISKEGWSTAASNFG